MLRATLYGARDLRMDECPLDPADLKSDEIYVETLVTALSTGTDLGNYLGDSTYVPTAPDYPRAVGYSNTGRIVAVGAGSMDWKPGDRVFSLRPHQSAYIARASDMLVAVPDSVAAEQAALAYLTQLGLAALQQTNYRAGEHVAVVGLGVIGLATVALSRVLGATVTAVANSPLRAQTGFRLGAHRTLLSGETGSERADVVVLTANSWDAYRTSLELARTGGRIAILGFPGRAQPAPDFNPLDPRWLYRKQLSLVGAGLSPRTDCPPEDIRFNLRRNMQLILERMADRTLDLEPAISHRFPAARMSEAYELAATHDKTLTAAVFVWKDPGAKT